MNTDNIEACIELAQARAGHGDATPAEAKAELSQLRAAAPQRVDGVLAPGWYWVKNPRYGKPWSVQYVNEQDCRRFNSPTIAEVMNMRNAEVFGPLTPPAEPTKAVTT